MSGKFFSQIVHEIGIKKSFDALNSSIDPIELVAGTIAMPAFEVGYDAFGLFRHSHHNANSAGADDILNTNQISIPAYSAFTGKNSGSNDLRTSITTVSGAGDNAVVTTGSKSAGSNLSIDISGTTVPSANSVVVQNALDTTGSAETIARKPASNYNTMQGSSTIGSTNTIGQADTIAPVNTIASTASSQITSIASARNSPSTNTVSGHPIPIGIPGGLDQGGMVATNSYTITSDSPIGDMDPNGTVFTQTITTTADSLIGSSSEVLEYLRMGHSFISTKADTLSNIFLGSGATTMEGDGNDYVLAGSGSEQIFEGNDANLTFIGGSGSATIYTKDGTSMITAGSGSMYLSGQGDGSDTLTTGSGTSTFYEGAGSDAVNFGSGIASVFADTATSGNSVFNFTNGSSGGTDDIYGFGANSTIYLHGYGSVGSAIASETVSGGSMLIKLVDSTTITLENVTSIAQNGIVGS